MGSDVINSPMINEGSSKIFSPPLPMAKAALVVLTGRFPTVSSGCFSVVLRSRICPAPMDLGKLFIAGSTAGVRMGLLTRFFPCFRCRWVSKACSIPATGWLTPPSLGHTNQLPEERKKEGLETAIHALGRPRGGCSCKTLSVAKVVFLRGQC